MYLYILEIFNLQRFEVYYMKSIISSLYLVLSVLRQDNNLIISVSKINLVHVLGQTTVASP